ncbi:hypothetical protein N9L68_03490 [bacterium]|nr:hypothetical protein [bacterium]
MVEDFSGTGESQTGVQDLDISAQEDVVGSQGAHTSLVPMSSREEILAPAEAVVLTERVQQDLCDDAVDQKDATDL